MTRPKKDEQTVRSNSIHIRMNDTEYELLQERANAVNMSIAEFIRNALDNQQVTIKYELVADVPEIKKLIGEPYEFDGYTIKIGISCGSAVYPDDADCAADIQKLADKRMYEDKKINHAQR